jgi:hypothetical protein
MKKESKFPLLSEEDWTETLKGIEEMMTYNRNEKAKEELELKTILDGLDEKIAIELELKRLLERLEKLNNGD